MFNLNIWTDKVFELTEKWWIDLETGNAIERNESELFCLMASELSEAMEGERKNLNDDKLPQYKMAGVEMADIVMRIMDYTSHRGIELFHYDPVYIYPEKTNRASIIWSMHRRLANAFVMSEQGKAEQLSALIQEARQYCNSFGYPFEEIFEAKFNFNIDRQDHKHESRKLADGKKF